MHLDSSLRLSKASRIYVGIGGLLLGAGGAKGGAAGSTATGGGGIAAGKISVCTRGGGTTALEDLASDGAIFLFFECVPSWSIRQIVD